MKKLFLLITLLLFISISFLFNKNVQATSINNYGNIISSCTEEFDDSSYIEYKLYENNILDLQALSNNTYTKSGTKTVIKYDSENNKLWEYILTADFTINEGISSICTNVNYSTQIYDNNWKFNNEGTNINNNIANGKGNFTQTIFWFIKTQTINIDISIQCDNHGNLL